MTFFAKFSVEASEDVQEIFNWYEEKSEGLGDVFLTYLDDSIHRLIITPGIGSLRFDDIHCTTVTKFPYFIYYTIDIDNNKIVVYRIFHTSRKPLWDK